MIFNYDHYSEKSESEDLDLVKKVYSRLCEWTVASENKIGIKNVTINRLIAYDAIGKSFEDMLRYRSSYNRHQNINTPDHFKEAAHFTYWIRRLKPFNFEADPMHPYSLEYQQTQNFSLWVNEHISLDIMEFMCVEGEIRHKRSPKVFRFPEHLRSDFLHMFRYKHVSPHALMLILRSTF